VLLLAGCGRYTPELTRADEEAAGAHCPSGGVALRSGIDADGDGLLDDAEVSSTRYVCAGAAGLEGEPLARFVAAPANFHIRLTWSHFADPARVVVRRGEHAYPSTPTSGTLVYDGTDLTAADTGLTLGAQYFYSAFRVDSGGSFSPPLTSTAFVQRSGDLDRTFNGGGYASTPLLGEAYMTDLADLVLDAKGRLVVSGIAQGLNGAFAVLWRFLPDGRLDATFGGEGVVVLGNLAGGSAADRLNAAAVDGSGNLVLVGRSDADASATLNEALVVVRLTEDGHSDSSFNGGRGRIVLHDVVGTSGASEIGSSVAIDGQGNIVVAGHSSNNRLILARFTSTGAYDTTFNSGGATPGLLVSPSIHNNLQTASLAIDSQGRLVTLEYGNSAATGTFDLALRRLSPAGAIDDTFGGGDGVLTVHSPASPATSTIYMYGNALALDASDRILVAGEILSTDAARGLDAYVLRVSATGAIDTTFGGAGHGMFLFDLTGVGGRRDVASALALDAQGRVIVGGASTSALGNLDAMVWRLNTDGTPDPTFQTTGAARLQDTAAGAGSDTVSALGVDTEGRLVAGGSSHTGEGAIVSLWRLVP
jgi:uncharacterized delta-60 repeat protein